MTIQPDGKRISGKSVSLQLIRREWHAVRKAGIGGRYQWLNKTVDVQVDSAVVTTKQQDVEQAFSLNAQVSILFAPMLSMNAAIGLPAMLAFMFQEVTMCPGNAAMTTGWI
jgi:hypothetical protein